jgi:hypothetical protein
MSQEIATTTFYILVIVTVVLQIIMYYKRNKFLRTIKGQHGHVINFKGSQIEEMWMLLQIVFPIKLDTVQGGQLQELRKSAVKATNHWIVSLIFTLTLPIILFTLIK